MARPRGRPNNPPNRNARLAHRRWKMQRERERLMREYMPEVVSLAVIRGLPLPGQPWWRSKWAEAGDHGSDSGIEAGDRGTGAWRTRVSGYKNPSPLKRQLQDRRIVFLEEIQRELEKLARRNVQ